MVIDTDTYNEIDDQFAVVQSLLSPDKLAVEAIYAAPFYNGRSDSPGDGMEKSYEEILRLLERLDVSADGLVHKGSTDILREQWRTSGPGRRRPGRSEASGSTPPGGQIGPESQVLEGDHHQIL